MPEPIPPWLLATMQQQMSGAGPTAFPMGGARNLGMWNASLGTLGQPLQSSFTPLQLGPTGSTGGPYAGPTVTARPTPAPPMPTALPTPPPTTPTTAASTTARGGLRGAFPMRGAGGLGLAGLGISALGPMVWNDPESSTDNQVIGALGYGATGASLGAGLGSFFPGPGTLVGGALGGVAGGLYGFFQGKNAANQEGSEAVKEAQYEQSVRLQEILGKIDTGRKPQQARAFRDQALQQLIIGWTLSEPKNKAQVKQVADQVLQQVVTALPADIQNTELMAQEELAVREEKRALEAAQREQRARQGQSERQAAANIAAVQAWMEPMLKEQLNKSQFYADQFRDAGMAAAAEIGNPGLRAASQAIAQQFSQEQASQNAFMLQQQTLTPQFLMQQWQAQAAEQEQIKVALDQQLREIQLREQGLNNRSQALELQQQALQQQLAAPTSPLSWGVGPGGTEGAGGGGATAAGARAGVAINPNTGLPTTYGVQYRYA